MNNRSSNVDVLLQKYSNASVTSLFEEIQQSIYSISKRRVVEHDRVACAGLFQRVAQMRPQRVDSTASTLIGVGFSIDELEQMLSDEQISSSEFCIPTDNPDHYLLQMAMDASLIARFERCPERSEPIVHSYDSLKPDPAQHPKLHALLTPPIALTHEEIKAFDENSAQSILATHDRLLVNLFFHGPQAVEEYIEKLPPSILRIVWISTLSMDNTWIIGFILESARENKLPLDIQIAYAIVAMSLRKQSCDLHLDDIREILKPHGIVKAA